MKKRILSMLLVIVLVLSVVPVSALAEGKLTITGTNYMKVGESVTLTLSGANAADSVSWESKETNVASVSVGTDTSVCEVTGISEGKIDIVATVNGAEKRYPVAVYRPTSEVPEVVADDVVDLHGGVVTLNYTVSTGTEKQKVVRWKSSNSKVATINWKGELTPVSEGKTNISVFYNGQWSQPKEIEIKDMTVAVENFYLSETDVTMYAGDTKTIGVIFNPNEATDKTLTWSSNKATVASVNAGVIKAESAGTATITAKHGDIEKTVTVTVTEAPVPAQSVTISGGQPALLRGGSMQLSATVLPEEATDKTVTWTISPAGVGEVSDDGLVTLYKAGTATTATVTAACGDKSGVFTFNITDPIGVSDVTISQKDGLKNVAVGSKLRLNATVTPDDAEDQVVTWTTSDNSIAKVNKNGVVTGVALGNAAITATCGGVSDTFVVTVIPATMITTDIPASIVAGKALDLKASVVDASGNPVPKTSVKWTLLSEEEGVTLTGSRLDTRSDMQFRHSILLRADAIGADTASVTVEVTVMPATTGIALKIGEEKVNNKTVVVDLSDETIMTDGIVINAFVQPQKAEPAVRWEISDPRNVCVDNQFPQDLLLTPVTPKKSGTVTVKAYAGDGSGVFSTTTIQFSVLGDGKLKDVPDKLRGGASLNMRSFLDLDQNLDDKTVTWSVRNNKLLNGKTIANISADGRLTTKPVSVLHTITVRVTGSSGGYAEREITLYPATQSITISGAPKTVKFKNGLTYDLSAAVKPAVAADWDLVWGVSDKSIARIDPDTGLLEILDAGKLRVTCESKDGSKVRGYLNIEITKDAADVEIKTPTKNTTLASGSSMDLTAIVWARKNVKAANQKVIWSISDEFGNATSAAIVSATGRVTAYNVDRNTDVLVTATSKQDQDVFGSIVLTIKPNTTKTLHAIIDGDMISGSYAMSVNESCELIPVWQKSGSDTETLAEDCQFFSSNTGVATIDQELGTLKAVGYGSSTITLRCTDPATKNECTSTFTVKVVKKVGTVTIAAPTLRELRSGKSATLKATAWADIANGIKADNQSFTWEVTEGGKETNAAAISSTGVLTAKTVTERHTVVVKAISNESGISETVTFDIFPSETVKFYFELNGEEYTGTLPVDLDKGFSGLKVRIHTAFADSKGYITDKDINPAAVTWSTSDANVIQIVGTGPQALKVGKAVLTAKYKIGNTTYESKITAIVNQIMGRVDRIDPSSILVAGKSINLRAVPANSNATNKNVRWSVSDVDGAEESVVDFVSINPYTGKLSAKKGFSGYSVKVTATPVDGSTPKSEDVFVYAATTKVAIYDGIDNVSGTKVFVKLSEKPVFYAAAEPIDAYQTNFKWISSDTSVAKVDENGEVTLKKAGSTVIKAVAMDGTGKYAKFTLRVTK